MAGFCCWFYYKVITMSNYLPDSLIPEQKEGAQSNTESFVEFDNLKKALHAYSLVKQRLLNVNRWKSLAGDGTANFQLIDSNGNDPHRMAKVGDYFQIDIPGPGSESGEGSDWVQIEDVKEVEENERQAIAIRVRPAANPLNSDPNTAHFFSGSSTSTFIVWREQNSVSAAVFGRNESPNTDNKNWTDKLRNTVVALGAMTGLAKLQWKSLVDGLLRIDKE